METKNADISFVQQGNSESPPYGAPHTVFLYCPGLTGQSGKEINTHTCTFPSEIITFQNSIAVESEQDMKAI